MKGNYLPVLQEQQDGEWFCSALVHFPNFLAVVHISALNKYLLKERKNLCEAAVVCVYVFWPYARVPSP